MKRILGIDEAGRGPVIGPLVLAGVLMEESNGDKLAELGVKDSKQLSRTRRNVLAPAIKAVADEIKLVAVPAEMLQRNLTQIELECMAQLIRHLRPTSVYLDAPVPPGGIAHFVSALRSLVGNDALNIIAENKADEKYPIVSAASILAKVHRDHLVEQLRAEYGNFGWGYPSEPQTQRFLEAYYAAHGTFPGCVRQRWRTVQRLIKNHNEQSFFDAS